MKKYLTTRNILWSLVGLFILLQIFRIEKATPEVDPYQDFITLMQPPADLAVTLKEACYDCHSYTTHYPWYAEVAPLSWWIGHHITEGREHLNFSVWGTYSTKKATHKLEECYEEVEAGKMPLPSYTWIHSAASLEDTEREALSRWFEAQYLAAQ